MFFKILTDQTEEPEVHLAVLKVKDLHQDKLQDLHKLRVRLEELHLLAGNRSVKSNFTRDEIILNKSFRK